MVFEFRRVASRIACLSAVSATETAGHPTAQVVEGVSRRQRRPDKGHQDKKDGRYQHDSEKDPHDCPANVAAESSSSRAMAKTIQDSARMANA